ncbi:MAG: hypothetical protein ABID38_07030 [Candidatus Diapherotrites archaeon]
MGEKAKLIPAIEVRYVEDSRQSKHLVSAEFYVCRAEKTRNGFLKKENSEYISNPEIRDAIEVLEKKHGNVDYPIGFMQISYDHKIIGTATWNDYLPFLNRFIDIFQRKGIERLLEQKVRDRAEKHFSKLRHFRHNEPLLKQRINQLIKRGHRIPEDYHLEDDKIFLRKQIAKDTQKHRQVRKRTRPR